MRSEVLAGEGFALSFRVCASGRRISAARNGLGVPPCP